MSRRNASSSNSCRWIQRDAFKEKLRVRERYWHPISSLEEEEKDAIEKETETIHWIIPDGLALRIYLPLIIYLVEREEEYSKRNESPNRCCRWVILESVADWMDYRSMSSTMVACCNSDKIEQLLPEISSPHERSKILTLIQGHRAVKAFCDLSVREGIREIGYNYDDSDNDQDEDEWDLMRYEDLSMSDRSKNALFRASRLFKQQKLNNLSKGDPSSSSSSSLSNSFYILSGDPNYVQKFPEEDGVQSILMEKFLDVLFKIGSNNNNNNNGSMNEYNRVDDNGTNEYKEDNWLNKMTLEHAKKLAARCKEDYIQRNDPTKISKRHLSVSDTGVEEYWTEDLIQQGLLDKTLVKGMLTVTKENIKEAIVLISSRGGDDSSSYFINQTKGYFNRAFHQDIVVVKPLPRQEWTSPVGRRRLIHVQNDDNNVNDTQNEISSDAAPSVPSGKVVAIANASRRQFVATMVDIPMNDESACLVVPMDARIPKIRIKTNGWRRFIGQRLWVQVDKWEVGSNHPSGFCVEIIGPISHLETEITCLLKENQIQLDKFSAAAQACLPLEGDAWDIPSHEISQRRDLRSTHRIFSVDPNGCQDIDDTFHARVLSNGDVEVGVHIADVTYFLRHNSPLDKEAQARATTFYLVDRRFDMLPSVLSGNLCSLHGDKDRLAVSTIWTMSRDFKVVKDFWYGRTVIRNCQAMTYDQAHRILHDLLPDDPTKPYPPPLTAGYPVTRSNVNSLKEDLSILTKLARKLKKEREHLGGAVDLSSGDEGNELKFTLDENHQPVRVTPKKQLEIHQTVAELMIMANSWVAKTIYEKFPTSALLRIHQNVDESRFEDLKEILNAGKISFDGSSNMKLADSLKKAERSSNSNSAVNSLFQSLATRAMSEAQYVSTGSVDGENSLSHYGLGIAKYTHFTSPIRRYADVVVHRQLLLTLTLTKRIDPQRPPPGFDRKALKSLPESKTISVILGEGIENTTGREVSTIENYTIEASSLLINSEIPNDSDSTMISENESIEVYSNTQVSLLCQTLNKQNRMAKLSSFECQGLFLSLYFKDQFEITKAVVTNLRSNGFWAYVPKFDFRAPVYLSDMNGVLQIDPALLKLRASSGLDPTKSFASSKATRRFPSGTCILFDSSNEDDHLDITVTAETTLKYQVRVLDVVTCIIFCDDWDTKSRIPRPKIQLIADTTKQNLASDERKSIESPVIAAEENNYESYNSSTNVTRVPSLYEETLKLETPPKLNVVSRFLEVKNSNEKKIKISIPGRVVFGNFVNPDTRSAQQEASIKDAAASALERRKHAMAGRVKQNEYDTTRRIESNVTARMQRLAASKRNVRKGKS